MPSDFEEIDCFSLRSVSLWDGCENLSIQLHGQKFVLLVVDLFCASAFKFTHASQELRIQYPGAMHHVMNRGDRGERIFLDAVDRRDFIKTLAETCQKTDWQVHAYCLMSDHSHLVLETPEPSLAPGMAWLQSTGTIRISCGSLYEEGNR